MKKIKWLIAGALVVGGMISVIIFLTSNTAGLNSVKKVRQLLIGQGFKTDLDEFNFSIPDDQRARTTLLLSAASAHTGRFHPPFSDIPDLSEVAGSNSVVVWQSDSLRQSLSQGLNGGDRVAWNEFADALQPERAGIDAAAAAILSGPLRFGIDARSGNSMLLPHLAPLRELDRRLGQEMILELHQGNRLGAWTNLMAATRLVTAWEPEPAVVSHMVRFANATVAFHIVWQGLQSNGWTDEELAQLQEEWESPDFFHGLPETVAFQRAAMLASFEQERTAPIPSSYTFTALAREIISHPSSGYAELQQLWQYNNYRTSGIFQDETNLLIVYRDREVELRKAIPASTWMAMRQFPGATNDLNLTGHYPPRTRASINLRSIALRTIGDEQILGRAAETEVRRRIIVTAIALERYHGRHGSYPETLARLAPEFLKHVPTDFIDGNPLRYQLTHDGHFTLYSVGLDDVDHGGLIPITEPRAAFGSRAAAGGQSSGDNIVWPLPANETDIATLRKNQIAARRDLIDKRDRWQAETQWEWTARHQAASQNVRTSSAAPALPEITYHDRPLGEILRNTNSVAANPLTLTQTLTPRQVLTGDEPEAVTFEIPIAYDALTNVGELNLLVDANDDSADEMGSAQPAELGRAENGNCRLAWHTIFECPGKHELQIGLTLDDSGPNKREVDGPSLSFTITNLCQFSLTSAHFDEEIGATLRAKLPEPNATYTIEFNATNGSPLNAVSGSTTDGFIEVFWDLIDKNGTRFTNDFFNSVIHLKLTDSGREQTMKGP